LANLLLIEDNPGDVRLIQTILKKAGSQIVEMSLVHADRLATGLNELEKREFDIILLDLGLPDAQGLEALIAIFQQAPDIPIIVLTGNQDEILALQAIRAGAHDYLVKGRLDGELLTRALRYAIERNHLLIELDEIRLSKQRDREMRSLERLSGTQQTAVTAQLYGLAPLSQTLPDLFAELVAHYGELLEMALEQQAYRVEYDVPGKLQLFADRLGVLRATPRDVIEIHATALKQTGSGATHQKIVALMQEGRLLVLELMGYLTTYYRNYAMGGPGALGQKNKTGAQNTGSKEN
jgi:DNA-binding NarL/FixJ family response regulator